MGCLTIRVSVPASQVVDMTANVVEGSVLFLGLEVMKNIKSLLEIGSKTIAITSSGWEVPLIRKHEYLVFERPKIKSVYYTELRRINRPFFHSHPEKVFAVLERANPTCMDYKDLKRFDLIMTIAKCVNVSLMHHAVSAFHHPKVTACLIIACV